MPKLKKWTAAIQGGINLGYNTMQFFTGNPRHYQKTAIRYSSMDLAQAKELILDHDLSIFMHSRYVSIIGNLACDDKVRVENTYNSIRNELDFVTKFGAKGLICHVAGINMPRTRKYIEQIRKKLAKLLNETDAHLILEIEVSNYPIAKLLMGGRRMSICIDTAHLWGAGIEISPNAITKHTSVIHLNGSIVEFASIIDKHGCIFGSEIPTSQLMVIVKYAIKKNIPLILETRPVNTQPDEIERIRLEWM